jgi:hypothetical protein
LKIEIQIVSCELPNSLGWLPSTKRRPTFIFEILGDSGTFSFYHHEVCRNVAKGRTDLHKRADNLANTLLHSTGTICQPGRKSCISEPVNV